MAAPPIGVRWAALPFAGREAPPLIAARRAAPPFVGPMAELPLADPMAGPRIARPAAPTMAEPATAGVLITAAPPSAWAPASRPVWRSALQPRPHPTIIRRRLTISHR